MNGDTNARNVQDEEKTKKKEKNEEIKEYYQNYEEKDSDEVEEDELEEEEKENGEKKLREEVTRFLMLRPFATHTGILPVCVFVLLLLCVYYYVCVFHHVCFCYYAFKIIFVNLSTFTWETKYLLNKSKIQIYQRLNPLLQCLLIKCSINSIR